MIVVTGASGTIGRHVVTSLASRGLPVRATSRDPSKLSVPAGVAVARADTLDPSTLDAAFAGATKVFVLAPAEDLPRAAANASAAAKRAGARHVVLVSSGTTGLRPEPTIGRWHREAEEAVAASGLAWTFLRPGNFATNSLRWAPSIRAQGKVFAPAGGPTAVIDPRDIADVAVAALAEDGHEGKAYLLTGEQILTAAEQVRLVGEAIGRELALVPVPPQAAREAMVKHGMPAHLADAILELMTFPEHDEPISPHVREVTGHPARTFADWARDHAAAFR
jgi:uncharacterized protein YbjT (DUF2867 family)